MVKILEHIPNHDDNNRFDLLIVEIDGKIEKFRSHKESTPYLDKLISDYGKQIYKARNDMAYGGTIPQTDKQKFFNSLDMKQQNQYSCIHKDKSKAHNMYSDVNRIVDYFEFNKDYGSGCVSIELPRFLLSHSLKITLLGTGRFSTKITNTSDLSDSVTQIITNTKVLRKYLESMIDNIVAEIDGDYIQ